MDTLPTGLEFSEETRTITGTPSEIGTTTVTYTATDSDSPAKTASLLFAITVINLGIEDLSTDVGYNRIRLTWSVPSTVSDIVEYQYKQNDGVWTTMTGSDATTAAYVVENLEPGTEYTFAIRAVGSNNAIITNSNIKTVTPGKITDDTSSIVLVGK